MQIKVHFFEKKAVYGYEPTFLCESVMYVPLHQKGATLCRSFSSIRQPWRIFYSPFRLASYVSTVLV